MLFTLHVGAQMKVTLQAGGSIILTAGKIMTRDPNVGNGIEFTSMTEKDRETLRRFIEGVIAQQKPEQERDNSSG
jgi:hypothetical protein